MTFNGRWPQSIERWISQQPLIGSLSNFRGRNQNLKKAEIKMTSNKRRPQIFKVEYLSNHWLDPSQIWSLKYTVEPA